MKLRREKLIGTAIIAAAVILAAAGYLILPDTLVVQISADGQPSNTLPKLPALLIPFAISTGFSLMYMNGEADRRVRNLIVAVLGLGIAVVMFVFNLAG